MAMSEDAAWLEPVSYRAAAVAAVAADAGATRARAAAAATTEICVLRRLMRNAFRMRKGVPGTGLCPETDRQGLVMLGVAVDAGVNLGSTMLRYVASAKRAPSL
ncbi:hypothetical protein CVT30_19950 [Streptomyces sp. AMCC400023]|nr:hypothetical protein CVT30_19950 [Streptomyces sp. AMCC400023]